MRKSSFEGSAALRSNCGSGSGVAFFLLFFLSFFELELDGGGASASKAFWAFLLCRNRFIVALYRLVMRRLLEEPLRDELVELVVGVVDDRGESMAKAWESKHTYNQADSKGTGRWSGLAQADLQAIGQLAWR